MTLEVYGNECDSTWSKGDSIPGCHRYSIAAIRWLLDRWRGENYHYSPHRWSGVNRPGEGRGLGRDIGTGVHRLEAEDPEAVEVVEGAYADSALQWDSGRSYSGIVDAAAPGRPGCQRSVHQYECKYILYAHRIDRPPVDGLGFVLEFKGRFKGYLIEYLVGVILAVFRILIA